jgi:GNAT superfamily N-acetyltransferase
MTSATVRLAETDADIDAVRTLCEDWLDWHWRNYPADWPPDGPDHPMNPDRMRAGLRELPSPYDGPGAGILIGSVGGRDVGCVMYHGVADGSAEFKRMFVSETARGHGLGRLMLDAMVDRMIADGYARVFFSSAAFLTHARAMYEAAGFAPMDHPAGFPEDMRHRVYFMDRALV